MFFKFAIIPRSTEPASFIFPGLSSFPCLLATCFDSVGENCFYNPPIIPFFLPSYQPTKKKRMFSGYEGLILIKCILALANPQTRARSKGIIHRGLGGVGGREGRANAEILGRRRNAADGSISTRSGAGGASCKIATIRQTRYLYCEGRGEFISRRMPGFWNFMWEFFFIGWWVKDRSDFG